MSSETTLQRKRDKTNNNFTAPIQLSLPGIDEQPVYIIKTEEETRLGFYVGPTPLNLASVDTGPLIATAFAVTSVAASNPLKLVVNIDGIGPASILQVQDTVTNNYSDIRVRRTILTDTNLGTDTAIITYDTNTDTTHLRINTNGTSNTLANLSDLYFVEYSASTTQAQWENNFGAIEAAIAAKKILWISVTDTQQTITFYEGSLDGNPRVRLYIDGAHPMAAYIVDTQQTLTLDHGKFWTIIYAPSGQFVKFEGA